MLFSTVLMWLLIAAGFVISLPALWLLAQGLWPDTVQRQQAAASRGLLKCFFLGLIPLAGGVTLIAVLSKIPKMGALAALAGGMFIAWGFLGAGGIAALIGKRLWPDAEPWRQTKHGGLVVVLCALLPVVGWIVLLPLTAVLGWGIVLRSWFVKAAPEPLPAPASETAAAELS